MSNNINIINLIEEARDILNNLLSKNIDINNSESLAASKELDKIINQYYTNNNKESTEITCMICGAKMHKKSG